MRRHYERWVAITDPGFGPLGNHLEQFKTQLVQISYAQGTIKPKMRIACHFNKWLDRRRLHAKNINEKTIGKFLDYYHSVHVTSSRHLGFLQEFLNWLRQQGITPEPVFVKMEGKFDYILNDYTYYLKHERGLAEATIKNYIITIRCFLSKRFKRSEIRLKYLIPSDITKFIFAQTKVYTLHRVQLITTALRSFFKYLQFRGDVKRDLAASVPTVADRTRSDLPRYLQPADVSRLLQSCDKMRPAGIRDYAILTIMARLGLRVGEIFNLTLDDINWEDGIMSVCGKTGYKETLPLPHDVGRAVAVYLKKSRRNCATRQLFTEARPPIEGLARSSICCVVRRACQRAGISVPHQGGHLLRHSLATRMLREGATMMDIAEVLRHRSPATTEIYAKVDINSLAELANPWPGVRL